MLRRPPSVRCGVGVFVLCATTIAAPSYRALDASHPDESGGTDWHGGQLATCATDLAMRQGLVASARATASSGTLLSFEQEPAFIRGGDTEPVVLRRLSVVGDFERLWVSWPRQGSPGYLIDEFTRQATTTLDGVLLSVFEPSWSRADLSDRVPAPTLGFDGSIHHGPYVGVTPPGVSITGPPTGSVPLTLRLAPSTVPAVATVRLSETVQYTARVVNIVLPGFGRDRVLGNAFGWRLKELSQLFYEHFADNYQTIIVVPSATALVSYGAFYRRVANDVSGIGLPVHDDGLSYGSAGVLRGVALMVGTVNHALVAHELGHQWGNYFDWQRISGIRMADTVHTPLWADRESSISARLAPFMRVVEAGRAWETALAPSPVRYHPMLLYAMGRLSREDVPPVVIFDDQQQSLGNLPGTAVRGPARSLTIEDVVAAHGARSGSAPSEWRVAVVVVGENALLPERDLVWWSFLAERLEDPGGTGARDANGQASFDAVAGVDLKTEIVPRDRSPLRGSGAPSLESFGTVDLPGITFDRNVPATMHAGETVVVSGAVDLERYPGATSLTMSFQSDLWALVPSTPLQTSANVSDAGSFVAVLRPGEEHRGLFRLRIVVGAVGSERVVGYFQPVEIR